MNLGGVRHVEELNSLVVQALRNIGIKYRLKKHLNRFNHDSKLVYKGFQVFKRPLSTLKTQLVSLKSGAAVEIPSFVVEACNHILERCDVEGIFRKAGSAARVREIKTYVDNGKQLGSQHHVVDVSNILKLFFRELPEPLLPYSFHDVLLRCLLLKERAIDGILLTCLLFPSIHLNTLAYLMEFFKEVASHEDFNKMGVTNLAIILTPSLMPVDDKIVNSGARLGHHVRVIELLMHNPERIGVLPESLAEKALSVGCISSAYEESEGNENDASKSKKKKKRRSGSLTRMFSGLKKMVGKGSPDSSDQAAASASDFPSPCVKSSKKRKLHESSGGFSSKKKKEILESLPQKEALCKTPLASFKEATRAQLLNTPQVNLDPKASSRFDSRIKSQLHIGKKSGKKLKKGSSDLTPKNTPDMNRHSYKGPRRSLDWQWKTGPWRRKKCLSSSDTPIFTGDLAQENKSSDSLFCSSSCTTSVFEAAVDLSDSQTSSDSDFVKISKSEYEDIKNRVSAIENRISQEFKCIASDPSNLQIESLMDESDEMCSAKKVQSAYEKTLEESEKLGDTTSTDQLAKRLSRELKIRQSLDSKIIRSPSARKIGTIRRRSRENARNSLVKVSKSSSPKSVVGHVPLRSVVSLVNQEQVFYPKSNLKRGRPNTVFSGLPHPSPRIPSAVNCEETPKNSSIQGHKSLENNACLHEVFVKPSCVVNTFSKVDQIYRLKDDLCVETVSKEGGAGPSLEIRSDSASVQRASSFHGIDNLGSKTLKRCDMKKAASEMDVKFKCPVNNDDHLAPSRIQWENAPQFFKKPDVQDIPVSGRESVVKIRNQNAGMVLARMRLFDKKGDPDGTPSRAHHIHSGTEFKSPRGIVTRSVNRSTEKLIRPEMSEERRHIKPRCIPHDSFSPSTPLKGSPKKIGSPRKKYHNQKSPKPVKQKIRPKMCRSPEKEVQKLQTGSERHLRKFNSLRETTRRSPLTSKGNITAPSSILNLGKENLSSTNHLETTFLTKLSREKCDKTEILQQIHLPDTLKETINEVCTPKIDKSSKISGSPLKDCNRIDMNSLSQCDSNRAHVYKTPKTTPYIKRPLLIKSPSDFSCTPYKHCSGPRSLHSTTPLRALPVTKMDTPILPLRSSPCVLSTRT